MVAREVPFVGTSTLFFGWRNLTSFFEAYGLANMEDVQAFWQPENSGKLGLKDFTKIVSFGLQKSNQPPIEPEYVMNLLDQYTQEHSLQDLVELIVEAQTLALVTLPDEGEAVGEAKNPRRTSKK